MHCMYLCTSIIIIIVIIIIIIKNNNHHHHEEQLFIDKMVMKNCRRRHTNLNMAWIDYKKAYPVRHVTALVDIGIINASGIW